MKDTLLSAALLIGILVASAIITQLFANAMYIRCAGCGTLNARRRVECRSCQSNLRPERD